MANENWSLNCEQKLLLFDLNTQVMLPIITWNLKENHEVEKFKLQKDCGTTTNVSIGNDPQFSLSMKIDKNDTVVKKILQTRLKIGNTNRKCDVFIIDSRFNTSTKFPCILHDIDEIIEENKVTGLDITLLLVSPVLNLSTKDALEGKEVEITTEEAETKEAPIDIKAEELENA